MEQPSPEEFLEAVEAELRDTSEVLDGLDEVDDLRRRCEAAIADGSIAEQPVLARCAVALGLTVP